MFHWRLMVQGLRGMRKLPSVCRIDVVMCSPSMPTSLAQSAVADAKSPSVLPKDGAADGAAAAPPVLLGDGRVTSARSATNIRGCMSSEGILLLGKSAVGRVMMQSRSLERRSGRCVERIAARVFRGVRCTAARRARVACFWSGNLRTYLRAISTGWGRTGNGVSSETRSSPSCYPAAHPQCSSPHLSSPSLLWPSPASVPWLRTRSTLHRTRRMLRYVASLESEHRWGTDLVGIARNDHLEAHGYQRRYAHVHRVAGRATLDHRLAVHVHHDRPDHLDADTNADAVRADYHGRARRPSSCPRLREFIG